MQDSRPDSLLGAPTAADRRAAMEGLSARRARELLEQARLLRRRNPSAAASVARSVLVWARTRGHDRIAAEAARRLGQAELILGHPHVAVRRLEEARQGLPAPIAARMVPELAQALAVVGEGERALEVLNEARTHAPDDERVRAMLDAAEGNILLQLERFDEALAPLERAKARYARLGHFSILRQIDANLGIVHSGLGDHDLAAALLCDAAAALDEAGDAAAAMQVRYNFAYVQFLRGEVHEALDLLTGLRDRFVALGDDRHAALCDLDRGELELRLGRRAQAGRLFEGALERFDTLGLDAEAARCRFFLAAVVRAVDDDPRTARRLLLEARRAFRAEHNAIWDALCRHRLAELALQSGRQQAALRQADRAADALARFGLGERAGRSQVLCARIELAAGYPDRALERLEPLVRSRSGSDWLACEAHHHSARVHAVLGNRVSATKHALRAIRVLERQRVKLPPDDHVEAFMRERRAVIETAASMVLWLGGRKASAHLERLADLGRHEVLREVLGLGGRDVLARPPFGHAGRGRSSRPARRQRS